MAMSLCVVWSYFHALYEPDSPMTTSFLVIAPNLIVFERLKIDFGDAATFRRDPLDPAGVDARLRPRRSAPGRSCAGDEPRRPLPHERPPPVRDRPEPAGRARLRRTRSRRCSGPRVNRDVEASSAEELFDRIAERERVMVLNDEAHHVHDEKLKWNQTIERLHDELRAPHVRRSRAPASSPSSTTRQRRSTRRAAMFRHVVVDYPLAQAVADGIVKTPVIGEVTGATVELGDTSFQRNRQWLDVAVGRWRAFNEALSPSGKRPVLFVMCENTLAADEAGDYLRQLPDFAGDQLLVIHTNRSRRDHQGRPRPRPPRRPRR